VRLVEPPYGKNEEFWNFEEVNRYYYQWALKG
jgi:hypothetical protein